MYQQQGNKCSVVIAVHTVFKHLTRNCLLHQIINVDYTIFNVISMGFSGHHYNNGTTVDEIEK